MFFAVTCTYLLPIGNLYSRVIWNDLPCCGFSVKKHVISFLFKSVTDLSASDLLSDVQEALCSSLCYVSYTVSKLIFCCVTLEFVLMKMWTHKELIQNTCNIDSNGGISS